MEGRNTEEKREKRSRGVDRGCGVPQNGVRVLPMTELRKARELFQLSMSRIVHHVQIGSSPPWGAHDLDEVSTSEEGSQSQNQTSTD
eukprot:601450-Rhodomonas_salina.1